MKEEPTTEPFEIDWIFEKQTGRIDNAFADNAFSISPDIKKAMKQNTIEDFENLCDMAQD